MFFNKFPLIESYIRNKNLSSEMRVFRIGEEQLYFIRDETNLGYKNFSSFAI